MEFTVTAQATYWSDEDGECPGETVEAGARYRVVDLIGWGWDLEKVSGTGPFEARLLNSAMAEHVRVVESGF